MSAIQLSDAYKKVVTNILRPLKNEIYVFGSRAKGTAKTLSDLDLMIKGPVDPVLLSQIKEAFEESNLPFKVDIVLWDQIDNAFRNLVEHEFIRLL